MRQRSVGQKSTRQSTVGSRSGCCHPERSEGSALVGSWCEGRFLVAALLGMTEESVVGSRDAVIPSRARDLLRSVEAADSSDHVGMERLAHRSRLARTGWIRGGRLPRGFFRGRALRERLTNWTGRRRTVRLANRLRAAGVLFQIHAGVHCKVQAVRGLHNTRAPGRFASVLSP